MAKQFNNMIDNSINKDDSTGSFFTDATTAEILAAIPTLSIPPIPSPLLRQTRVVVVGGSIGGLTTAACLRAAGFTNVTVIEKESQSRKGNGIGLDDASVGILKGLGVGMASYCTLRGNGNNITNKDEDEGTETRAKDVTVQRMRWAEERVVNPEGSVCKVLSRQPYPYSAVRYSELTQGLETVAMAPCLSTTEGILRGKKAVRMEEIAMAGADGEPFTRVHLEDASTGETTTMDCDLVVVADGPRSRFRSMIANNSFQSQDKDDLRFAGYTAWRGTVPEADLPEAVRLSLRKEYPHFSNCLYFIWGPPGKSAVLYDIGNGLINWLVYECCDQPKAPPGRTTTTATPNDIAYLKQHSKSEWGNALGAIMECTPEPFQNDIYDIQTPLTSFINTNANICLLGDAAHPITPHCAKGSNLAIHDAYLLASAAQHATSVHEMLQLYSNSRVEDCRNTVLWSRHLGRMRNGMPPMTPDGILWMEEGLPRPLDPIVFLSDVLALNGGILTATLPLHGEKAFAPTWKFMEDHVPESQRGFWLARKEEESHPSNSNEQITNEVQDEEEVQKDSPPAPLEIVEVNHISLETEEVDQLVSFYQNVLGLSALPRPNFGFGGAWLELPGGQALHIIERDPEKPNTKTSNGRMVPERFIRRSQHVALTVLDIEAAKATLHAHGITFAINRVPDTVIEQLFLYDPDGNGIEIGNFNA